MLEDRALTKFIGHGWSGNVREMLSVLKRAVFLSDGPRIGPEHIELERTRVVEAPAVTHARYRVRR